MDALHEAAARFGDLDTERVAIRGWSFGGYLAALAVLRRPDVFGAAIAGAPVTDWRLYDTHYTERYLGLPDQDPEAYERCSLINWAERAGEPRPLMLIHGLADDNVVVAHTLRLSGALLAAGYPHRVLPLSGITHMASQEAVAENLLLLQLDFLRGALGVRGAGGGFMIVGSFGRYAVRNCPRSWTWELGRDGFLGRRLGSGGRRCGGRGPAGRAPARSGAPGRPVRYR